MLEGRNRCVVRGSTHGGGHCLSVRREQRRMMGQQPPAPRVAELPDNVVTKVVPSRARAAMMVEK